MDTAGPGSPPRVMASTAAGWSRRWPGGDGDDGRCRLHSVRYRPNQAALLMANRWAGRACCRSPSS